MHLWSWFPGSWTMRGQLGAGSRGSGSGRCRVCLQYGSRSGRGRWSHPWVALKQTNLMKDEQYICKCFPPGKCLVVVFQNNMYVMIYGASFESVELWIKCFCQVVIFVSKTSTANCYCRRLENPELLAWLGETNVETGKWLLLLVYLLLSEEDCWLQAAQPVRYIEPGIQLSILTSFLTV